MATTEAPSGAPATEPRAGVPSAAGRLVLAMVAAVSRRWRQLRHWNRRGGAGSSGLATLIEVHTLAAAGDATVAVALAGSLFFQVPTHEARSRVALYLLITMAPFAVVAPVLGPLLDRFRHGRRIAIAATMLARAVLALVIGHSLTHTDPLALYPAALGLLVAGKAYGIVRSAAVPRLTPPGMTLVQANARLTLASAIAPGVAGVLAVAVVKVLGHRVELVLGAAVYCLAAYLTSRLPRVADGGDPEEAERPVHGGLLRRGRMGPDVEHALRSAAALRWLSGFLLLYGAFVVREHPIGGLPYNVCLGALALGFGAGNVLGTAVGPRTASVATTRLAAVLLAATLAMCLLAALEFTIFTVFAVAVVTAGAAAVSKLALDANIQRYVDDAVRTSTFARSETTLQLAWVVGGAVGILLPTRPGVGLTVATVVLAVSLAVSLGVRPPRRRPASSAPTAPTG